MRTKIGLLFFLLVAFPAFANDGGVAIVDLKQVASESSAGKDIEEQMKKINDESKVDLLDLESQIKSMENTKKTGADTRKIEELQVMLYDMVREKKYKISEAYQKTISKLDAAIKKSIKAVCKRKKIAIVIAQDAVVYFDKNICKDITRETIEELNNICPVIQVEFKEAN